MFGLVALRLDGAFSCEAAVRVPVLKPSLRTVSTRIAPMMRGDAAVRSAKPTLDFYGTAAWKAVRLEVQRACGRSCQQCGKANTRIYVDHVVELRDGGAPLDKANLVGLCASCHGKKSARERAKRQMTDAGIGRQVEAVKRQNPKLWARLAEND